MNREIGFLNKRTRNPGDGRYSVIGNELRDLFICMFVYNSAVLTAHSCILIIGSCYLVTAEDIIGDGREIFRTFFKVMRLNIETMKLIMQASRNI